MTHESGNLIARYTRKTLRQQVFVLMAIYIAVLLLTLPYARSASSLPWKIVLALAPAVPVVIVIGLIAKLVMHSDELNQHVHLVALSVATGMVAALSLVGGFLCASGVITLDGDILIWVFPALCFIYGVTRWLVARRYGGLGC